MGNGNDILDMYLYETNTLLGQLDEIVLSAERAGTFSQDDVNEIFRIMHTIKGSSAMMEYNSLMNIAHRIEDLFFVIRERTMDAVPEALRPELFDLMFQSIDFFREEVGKLESGESLSMDIDHFLQNINSFLHKIQPEEAGETGAAAPPAAGEDTAGEDAEPGGPLPAVGLTCSKLPHGLHVFFDEGCKMENLRAFMLVNAMRDFCGEGDLECYPADVETNAATCDFIVESGFLLYFRNEADRDRAIPVVTASGTVRTYQTFELEQVQEERETGAQAAPAEGGQPAAAEKAGQQHAKESLISVSLSKLDQLMAVVGEIVITESMVIASPDLKDLKLDNFNKSARQLRKLTDELQDVSMSLRMVPVSGTFQKMNRVVRDMGKKLGKQVQLNLVGETTEVDKTIVDTIADPIMHIVRNSMDHGIEERAEDRLAAGKPAVGQITLSARHTGSEVIIEIKDDGQGVDCDKVLDKAIRQGLATPGAEYSNREILNFLLMPGFSTNAEVTEFSGRGVGMDVVKSNVESVGGTVTIASQQGQGMTTTLKIPLTMAILDGMEVSVGDSIFTVPIINIRQIFKVSESEVIYDAVRGEMIKCMDNFYPVIRAKEFFRLQKGMDDLQDGILLWVESGENSYCLFVDELIGEQQVVVKPLPNYVTAFNIKSYGIAGCTILGDGNISIIIEVANLYTAAQNG